MHCDIYLEDKEIRNGSMLLINLIRWYSILWHYDILSLTHPWMCKVNISRGGDKQSVSHQTEGNRFFCGCWQMDLDLKMQPFEITSKNIFPCLDVNYDSDLI